MLPNETFTAPDATALLKKLAAASPQFDNSLLLQLADYFRQRGVTDWDKLARIALGYFGEGDRFKAGVRFSRTHARALVPTDAVDVVLPKIDAMAKKVTGPQVFHPEPPLSRKFWFDTAQYAWPILQAERKKGGLVPKVPPIKIPPIDPDPIIDPIKRRPRPIRSAKRAGGAILLLLALFVLSKEAR